MNTRARLVRIATNYINQARKVLENADVEGLNHEKDDEHREWLIREAGRHLNLASYRS